MEVASSATTNRRAMVLLGSIACAIGLGFALYTHHAWEDFYILFRCCKNFVQGQGLVYNPGERVLVLSSPLSAVLTSALCYVVPGSSDRVVLWLLRLVGCSALAGTAVLLYRIAKSQSFNRLAIFSLLGMLLMDPKCVDYSVNGMETGLMLFFLAWTLHSLLIPARRTPLWLGLAWAGLLWTRADGCIYIAVIGGAFFLFNAAAAVNYSRLQLLKTYLVAGAIAAILYLPWPLWTWSYYGSPIPHTVVAKGLGMPASFAFYRDRVATFLEAPFSDCFRVLTVIFAPPYAINTGWPEWMLVGCQVFSVLGATYWLLPFGQRETRAVSLAFFLAIIYMVCAPCPAPWYLPSVAVLGIFVLGQMLYQVGSLLRRLQGQVERRALWRAQAVHVVVSILFPAFSAYMLLGCAAQMRVQQREVERGCRQQIGLWLRDNVTSAKDTIFLEPLGYVGYYSQRKILDYPGLSSPEVIKARLNNALFSYAKIIQQLNPDWLVLRPCEVTKIQADDPQLLVRHYRSVKVFDVRERVMAYYGKVPGLGYPMCDAMFTVYQRTDHAMPPAQTAAAPAAAGAAVR